MSKQQHGSKKRKPVIINVTPHQRTISSTPVKKPEHDPTNGLFVITLIIIVLIIIKVATMVAMGAES